MGEQISQVDDTYLKWNTDPEFWSDDTSSRKTYKLRETYKPTPQELRSEREVAIMQELEKGWEKEHGPIDVPLSPERIKSNQDRAKSLGVEWDGKTSEMTEGARDFFYDLSGGGKNSVPIQLQRILLERFPEYRVEANEDEIAKATPGGDKEYKNRFSAITGKEHAVPFYEDDQLKYAPNLVTDYEQALNEAYAAEAKGKKKSKSVELGDKALKFADVERKGLDKWQTPLDKTKSAYYFARAERKNDKAKVQAELAGSTYKEMKDLGKVFSASAKAVSEPESGGPAASYEYAKESHYVGHSTDRTEERFKRYSEAAREAAIQQKHRKLMIERWRSKRAAERAKQQREKAKLRYARRRNFGR